MQPLAINILVRKDVVVNELRDCPSLPLDTEVRETEGPFIKNGQSRDTSNIGNTRQSNVRENRSGNQEWTIQKHKEHWVRKSQDEDTCRDTRMDVWNITMRQQTEIT